MATINHRGPFQFQAIVRVAGTPTQTETFETRKEAEAWAAETEGRIKRGSFIDRRAAQSTFFREVLERYEKKVVPTKRGAEAELPRIRRFKTLPFANKPLSKLTAADFSAYRDQRLTAVAPSTVARELNLLSAILSCAIKDWGYPIDNPIPRIRKPRESQHRERRLSSDEQVRLLAAADDAFCRAPQLSLAIELAIETWIRAGELVRIKREQVNLGEDFVLLYVTKNGSRRIVPLTERATVLFERLLTSSESEKLFSFYDTRGLSSAFRRATKRAGITGLTFHDLRHEAASRFAKRMQAPTLAKVMGWKTLQIAMRYYNPTAAELVAAVRAA